MFEPVLLLFGTKVTAASSNRCHRPEVIARGNDDRVVGSQETPREVNTGSPCRTGRPVKPYVSGIIEEWCEVISHFPSLNS
ncbi:hypothetical protein ELH97_24490 (plasmid) [Rhizobium leguminosarum]|nr:hypothetical protein ELI05_25470 [Rhizobium leguminosarum]TAX87603.1 hypothetical protein ELH97_24490 [Rhizobium leguminosarum]TAX88899.1 hypothetical protein ELH94_24625 [Rhizobium leguminosarum]TAY91045.1 hypothetical protein ELH79_25555 [Rhizobium leguminosarum]TAZ04509.1 hypothetical protein ELH78_27275 [Rhizobium leguminosarum]